MDSDTYQIISDVITTLERIEDKLDKIIEKMDK